MVLTLARVRPVVQGDLRVRHGGGAPAARRRREPEGGDETRGEGPRTPTAHRRQVDTARGKPPFPVDPAHETDNGALQKFVARKARKAQAQNGRLCLPALELAAIYGGVAHAPREAILSRMIPLIESTLAELETHEATPASYHGGQGYWDDLCLARYLEGLCMRFVAYPVSAPLSLPTRRDSGNRRLTMIVLALRPLSGSRCAFRP